MSELVWRENWQLNDPAELNLNMDGSFTIKDPVGDIFLPDDYIAFMRRSEGAALRDRGSCFLGQFHDGVIIFEIEWLGSLRNLRLSTRRNYYDDEAEDLLPRFLAFIGYAEPGPSDVLINVSKGDPDYGKVYVWTPAKDPWMTGDNTRGLGWVADSFADFMNNLAPKEAL
ncbi:SMI1/KNR4 family protein [Sulfitobacter pacificus]|uniref:SMI1/KNR4 family protein n=1 Tax=Sulfitobacter pacificus TaxID=1499314 RepID=UPI0031023647